MGHAPAGVFNFLHRHSSGKQRYNIRLHWYRELFNSGILKSTDRGETWAWWNQGIFLNPETSVLSLAIDPSTPSVMYAGTGGFNGGSLFKSTDAGRSWEFLSPPDEIGFRRILVQPDAGNNLLVATTGHGRVLRSTDAGESWSVQLDSTDQVLSLESTMAGGSCALDLEGIGTTNTAGALTTELRV